VTELRFLALGDSYTIGESVEPGERWPVQLAAMLREQGLTVEDPVIIARTGWTTAELDEGIDRAAPEGDFDLVSLLIGVNNQYRGLGPLEYKQEFEALLERAIGFAGGEPSRVVVLSIPDWGMTPFGSHRDTELIASEIDQFNSLNAAATAEHGAWYVDVTPISREAPDDPDLIAGDGLHPSGKMYGRWAELALPVACEVLGAGG
jgi:lysophospholipase L1-like esterase